MEIKSILKKVRLSAQKCRLVANLIRGQKVNYALKILTFSIKKSALIIKKVLKSAIANAENNNKISINNLYIKKIYIEKASSLKRFIARAKGRGNHIFKKSCHIYLILGC